MSKFTDETIPDEKWWYSDWGESEDFNGISKIRIIKLVKFLKGNKESRFIINRLLHDNNMKHGLLNSAEFPRCKCYNGK